MVSISKINFGAVNVQPGTVLVNPTNNISNTPIQDNLGYMQTDLYGTKASTQSPKTSSKAYYADSYTPQPQYAIYSQRPTRKKSSGLKTLLVLGGLTAAGILAYKKRAKISNFFKRVINGDKAVEAEEKLKKAGKKTKLPMRDRPPEIVSLEKFNEYYSDTAGKIAEDNYQAIEPEDLKVIFKNKDAATKKETLKNLFSLAEIYNQKELQSRVTIMMPESLSDKANHIVDMFAKGKIDKIRDKHLAQIEGFKILRVERTLADRHDIVVDKQVRHGINAGEAQDVGQKWSRNIGAFFKRYL